MVVVLISRFPCGRLQPNQIKMKLDRRSFLQISGVSLLTGAGFLASTESAGAQRLPVKSVTAKDYLSTLNAENFSRYIGQEFTVYNQTEAFTVVLTAVETKSAKTTSKSSRGKVPAGVSDCFLLHFSAGDVLSQDVYGVHHPALGLIELLLVPGRFTGGATQLTATFNRI
jgi:hypothetical protein